MEERRVTGEREREEKVKKGQSVTDSRLSECCLSPFFPKSSKPTLAISTE